LQVRIAEGGAVPRAGIGLAMQLPLVPSRASSGVDAYTVTAGLWIDQRGLPGQAAIIATVPQYPV